MIPCMNVPATTRWCAKTSKQVMTEALGGVSSFFSGASRTAAGRSTPTCHTLTEPDLSAVRNALLLAGTLLMAVICPACKEGEHVLQGLLGCTSDCQLEISIYEHEKLPSSLLVKYLRGARTLPGQITKQVLKAEAARLIFLF